MRDTLRTLTVTASVAGLLAAAPAAAAAEPSASPRVVDLKPRVITLTPRIVDIAPKKEKNTYTVDSDVLFAFNSAKLSGGATNVLDDLAGDLKSDGARKAVVTGYTDSVGSSSYNRKLSERRAQAVRDYLRQQASDVSYTAKGLGEKNPVAANKKPDGSDNPRGRRQNRRVTVSYS